MKLVNEMSTEQTDEKEVPLKPIPVEILDYYKPYVNDLFYEDGISYSTQKEFQIGYDTETNRITIPIYSEIGDLVGVKGRLFQKEVDESECKYLYLEKCAKSKILFGLNKTLPYIKRLGHQSPQKHQLSLHRSHQSLLHQIIYLQRHRLQVKHQIIHLQRHRLQVWRQIIHLR